MSCKMQLYPFTSTKMGFMASVSRPPRPIFFEKRTQADSFKHGSFSKLHIFAAKRSKLPSKRPDSPHSRWSSEGMAILVGSAGIALASVVGPSHAAEYPILSEPSNALSLPTWAVHVSSVVEWTTAMALVWRYGETSGYESWKGLSWGMVPLLGGAICACTWHFFYNSESLEVLVALQAALTVIGNATMCIAAYRIYTSSQESSKNP